jgi:hypothetical protein
VATQQASVPSALDALDFVAETPFRAGLAVGLALTLAVVLLAGSPAALAAAPTLVGLGLVASYAVDTAVEWVRWLSERSAATDTGTGTNRPPRADGTRVRERASPAAGAPAPGEGRDALDRLRERYAEGELDDATFERKLEALLETGTPEGARRRAARTGRRDEEPTATGSASSSESEPERARESGRR